MSKVAQIVATASSSYKLMFFIIAQKVTKYLGYLKNCYQELSKIAQSGHTGPTIF